MTAQPKIARRLIEVFAEEPEPLAELAAALRAAGYRVTVSERPEGDVTGDLVVLELSGESTWPAAEDLAGERLILLVDTPEAMRRGFDLGAEDCVLADAHVDEVVARCEAVLRRTNVLPELEPEEPAVYVDRVLWVNFSTRQVWVLGKPAHLTPREFRLLQFLVRGGDETQGHGEILAAVWDRPEESDRPTEVLKQYVWRLRQKIEADPNHPAIIVTDPGEGYRFVSHLA